MIKRTYKSLVPEKQRIELRLQLERLMYPFYLGNNYQCNICGKSFRKLITKGKTQRQNAKCPYCFSLERERLLDFYLDQELDIYHQEGLRILHFAPEFGLGKKLSSIPNVVYIDADINPAVANHVVDITDIPFEDDFFDLIICSHVLACVPNENLALEEIKRVLKPNGKALIITRINKMLEKTYENSSVISEEDKLEHFGHEDVVRMYGLDFGDRLRSQGFNVEEIDYREQFSKEEQNKYSLGDDERGIIFQCTK